ncbi:DUF4822 domain-containing protein [Listeria rustica]|uniref:DUF4822 domain-containing protein n=1 Tax=Listeria rustica TaxID=2713503 RepID=A0A7W1T5A2_9LIST|nr:DUF4822 domain-containing protein [Listeria rustica]MBA3925768.1 DUF4822 domain-containing protein [Listeria rustica]
MKFNKKLATILAVTALSTTVLAACGDNNDTAKDNDKAKTTETSNKKDTAAKNKDTQDVLSSTNWQGTKVTDDKGNDVTQYNQDFIGLAKYDNVTARYEFFDKEGKARGDEGYYFVTQDGAKRVLSSTTKNYNVVVDLVTLQNDKFVYERTGKDADGKDIQVSVEHVPYSGDLKFTNPAPTLTKSTGDIDTSKPGRDILANTLWHGTVVMDEQGNDVTAFNKNFISIAKYDNKTNKYEFFNTETGATSGDYGYFDVVNNNKMRFHVSLGKNYAAPLELTELNNKKFTYKRTGKDAAGKDITVYVSHEPYSGDLASKIAFTH